MPRTQPRAGTTRGLTARLAGVLLAASTLAACAPESEPEAVAAAAQPVAAVPVWTVTSEPMTVARNVATATRLPNGRVLVAGGRKVGSIDTGDVFFETAEVFDPKNDGFLSLATVMSAKRVGHTATSLAGGDVLVAGGNSGVATADVFDASSATWQPTAPLAHPRSAAASVRLGDGRVLVTGGDPDSATAEVFDPATQTWTETGPMLQPRQHHTATLLQDGRVLVAGGRREGEWGKATASAEVFDPATATWSSVDAMGTARLGHTATLLPGGRVLVAGGSAFADVHAFGEIASAEIYTPANGGWTPVPPMSTERAFHTAIALENGGVLVAGGVDATSSVLRSTELFDPELLVWVTVGLLTHGRLQHVAAPLAGGAVFVAGGEHQSSAEIYRPAGIGQPCEIGRQCASGFCVDEVCCDVACAGACLTCALPGAEGICSPAAPGTDPHLDCGKGGPCDDRCGAAGECADRVGELCVAPECIDDRTRAIVPATCAESGSDCPRIAVDCAPYRCGPIGSPPADGCLTRCASIDDCAPGYACDTEGRCRLRPDVAAIDPEACAASARGEGTARGAAAWLSALALAVSALRLRRRSR